MRTGLEVGTARRHSTVLTCFGLLLLEYKMSAYCNLRIIMLLRLLFILRLCDYLFYFFVYCNKALILYISVKILHTASQQLTCLTSNIQHSLISLE